MTNLYENNCRLCLAEKKSHFTELTKTDPLLEIIFNLTSLEALPESITFAVLCDECRELLLQYDQFRESCLQNNKLFLATLDSEECCGTVAIEDNVVENIKIVKIEEDDAQQKLYIIESLAIENVQQGEQQDGWKEETEKVDDVNQKAIQAESRVVKKPNKKVNKAKQKSNTNPKPTKVTFCASTSNRYLPCEQCGKMIRRSNMRKHLETHNPKPPQLCCSHCGKKYKDSNLLKVHINSHHTFERKYECEECGKIYYRPNSLREHIYAKHSEVRRFECDECGMKFTNFSKKTYHYIMAHTVAKPFSCQFCDKAFKLK
uniref:Protein krueppel n=1 Tax=Anopheles culicifacies TaxID=139723 RepID=A0A182M1R9_9DIPT